MILLNGEINSDSYKDVVTQLLDLKKSTVDLWVTSGGGDLELTFGIHDLLKSRTEKITTRALGMCQSAAPLLVACGDDRASAPNCIWMLHSVSLDPGDVTVDGMRNELEWADQAVEAYASLLNRYTKKNKQFWKRKLTGPNVYFDAATARDWGLVDRIL